MKGELIAEVMGKIYLAAVVLGSAAAIIIKSYNLWTNYREKQNQK